MYELKLTGKEVEILDWLVARGYFPEVLFDEMYLEENEDEPIADRESTYIIPEHAAWSLVDMRDDEAYLSCLGEPLLSKILDLENQIV
jgi:hypothetical protein